MGGGQSRFNFYKQVVAPPSEKNGHRKAMGFFLQRAAAAASRTKSFPEKKVNSEKEQWFEEGGGVGDGGVGTQTALAFELV